jgi:hypothetical protein
MVEIKVTFELFGRYPTTGDRSARGSAGKDFERTEGIESGADAGFRSRSGVGWSMAEEEGEGVEERKGGRERGENPRGVEL